MFPVQLRRPAAVAAALLSAVLLAAPAQAYHHHVDPPAPDPADQYPEYDPAVASYGDDGTDPGGVGDDQTWYPDGGNAGGPPPAVPGVPGVPGGVPSTGLPGVTTAPVVTPVVTGKTVPGTLARMRADGKAAIPRGAPLRVRAAISAANAIVGKPYKWGGGHGRLNDTGYDCSGSVGYALIKATLMAGSMTSGQMAHWGSSGPGRWITIYANSGHVYMEIAGLRLDTSPYGDPTGRMGVRWRGLVGKRRGFTTRHPPGL